MIKLNYRRPRGFLCSRSSFGFIAYVTMDRRVLSLTWMEPPEMCRQPYAVDRRINLSNLYSHLNYVKAWIAVFIPILHAFNIECEQSELLFVCQLLNRTVHWALAHAVAASSNAEIPCHLFIWNASVI
ncbi:hypothetical protein NPIL_522711 [Nephila pilipes]|uniref:Uncharacterized protein n=1 Tax=Nephila pilipes TaxID=299642 RepID=A0A8X6T8C0_NEPPI|nr:hypothetical protein NPIL_522711 [Nephila pilipes]